MVVKPLLAVFHLPDRQRTPAGSLHCLFHISTDAGRGAGDPCCVPSAGPPAPLLAVFIVFSTSPPMPAGVPAVHAVFHLPDRQHSCWQFSLFFPHLHRCRQGCRRSMLCSICRTASTPAGSLHCLFHISTDGRQGCRRSMLCSICRTASTPAGSLHCLFHISTDCRQGCRRSMLDRKSVV